MKGIRLCLDPHSCVERFGFGSINCRRASLILCVFFALLLKIGEMVMFVSFVYLLQPRIIWKESFNEGLSIFGGMSAQVWVVVLCKWIDVERLRLLWVASFPRQGNRGMYKYREAILTMSKKISELVCIPVSLFLTVDIIWLAVWRSCLGFPTIKDYNLGL